MFGNKPLSNMPPGLLELFSKNPAHPFVPERTPNVARALSPRMQRLLRVGDKDRAYLKRDGTVWMWGSNTEDVLQKLSTTFPDKGLSFRVADEQDD